MQNPIKEHMNTSVGAVVEFHSELGEFQIWHSSVKNALN